MVNERSSFLEPDVITMSRIASVAVLLALLWRSWRKDAIRASQLPLVGSFVASAKSAAREAGAVAGTGSGNATGGTAAMLDVRMVCREYELKKF